MGTLMAASPPTSSHELTFGLILRIAQRVNPEWLEAKAIETEDALIERGRDLACGYSVSANFEDPSFEVDYTVQTANLADAYDQMSQIVRIIEDVIGFSLEPAANAEATASATVAVSA